MLQLRHPAGPMASLSLSFFAYFLSIAASDAGNSNVAAIPFL
jgi:hypothetical protein